MEHPKPPATLSKPARQWWEKLQSEYGIVDAGGMLVLNTAMAAFDRMEEAKRTLKREGTTFSDRFGQPRGHPSVVIERDSRAAMLQALRALHLDIEPLKQPGRPAGS